MTEPTVSEFEINDGENPVIRISVDHDADPSVRSFVLDQTEAGDYIYVTLDGLRALVKAAEQLKR